MSVVREASQKRRSIVENVGIVNGALFDRFLEGAVFLPPLGDGFFVFDGLAALAGLIFHVAPILGT